MFKNIPKQLFGKLNFAANVDPDTQGNIEVVILYGDEFQAVNDYVNKIGAKLENLGYGFGIVTINVNNIVELARSPNIQYIELPKSLYLTDVRSNGAACVPRVQSEYGLLGDGTVIGFIDSGIDYTHPAFRNEDGSTRIDYIYDLSLSGAIYNRELINQALNSPDPSTVVPSYDLQEHGTHVAGIACAGGTIAPQYYGVAPKSSIIMVKCTRGNFALSTQIMRGMKFLVDKGKELNKPLAVNISLSTNDGAHNGSSLLEQYINTVATLERITIVIAAGNEGDAGHHIGGTLLQEKTISFNVADDETAVIINLYKSVLPKVSIELITPMGKSTGALIVEEGYEDGVISQNRYEIYNTGPKPFDINGEIGISLVSGGNYIVSGQWTIKLKVINEFQGLFDMWLPIVEGLNQRTRFLQPTSNNTLGIPATAKSIISVGSYNYITQTVSSFSGRGKITLYEEFKPSVVAPGEGIVSTIPNESFDTKSGTSMATPHVTGIAALMMEWGISKGNDPFLYGDRLKYYLIVGAVKNRSNSIYPDISWGYGEVCAYNSLREIIEVLNIINVVAPSLRGRELLREPLENKLGDVEEYKIGALFIRKPL
ncbi:S8 family peptidase [Clostridium vincentii]|uniref:S8 family peptidase n=1 Tax=Clostridium vincentii TaxID=52704 RepID=UPI001FA8DAC4|nr:S8 family peptidase [Clostridium vincentii]